MLTILDARAKKAGKSRPGQGCQSGRIQVARDVGSGPSCQNSVESLRAREEKTELSKEYYARASRTSFTQEKESGPGQASGSRDH